MKQIILLIAVSFCFWTCDRNCQYTEETSITASVPSAASVGQTVSFNLDYGVDGCGGTPRLIESVDSNHRDIKLEVDVTSPDCLCTQELILRQFPYTFTPTTSGVYTFEFYRPYSDNILDTLIVN